MKIESRAHRAMLMAATSGLCMMMASAAFAQSAEAPAESAAPQATAAGDDQANAIVVLGVRGAQKVAVDFKRRAPQIVDSIVAEDIGKLPDVTIADSLQRVPGIQIDRSAGEGSGINIRGLQQVLVTINGEEFLGGSNIDGAQPNFSDIPPTLFSGVDVYKSTTAKQVEGGVSGIVDLKTRHPFDLKKNLTLSAEAQGDYGSHVQHLNEEFSGLVGWHNDSVGILVAGSYSNARLANDTIDTGNSWLASADSRPKQGFYYQPAVVTVSNKETQRKRYGLDGSLQIKASDSITLTGDIFYTRLDNRDRDVGLEFNSSYGPLPLQAGSQVDQNGVVSVGQFQLPNFTVDSASVGSRSQAMNTNLQLDFNNGGRFKGSLRWVYGHAVRTSESSYVDAKPVTGSTVERGDTAACRDNPTSCTQAANPNGLPYVNAGINYANPGVPSLNFGTDVTNPANYNIMSTWAFGDRRVGTNNAFRADGSYDLGGFFKSIDFGARYDKRSVDVENYRYLSPVTVPGLGLLNQPGDLYYFKDPEISHTGRPAINGLSVLPLYPFSAVPNITRNFSNFIASGIPAGGIPAVDPAAMDNALAFQNSLFPGNQRYVDPTTSFRVRERSIAGYVQANFEGDLLLPISGNAGLRVVQTSRSVYSSVTDPNNFIGTGGSYNGVAISLGTTKTTKDYTRVLPNFNLTANLSTNQKLRFAFAKVVGVLDLYDLGAGRVLYYGANNGRYPNLPSNLQVFLQGSSGNPNLEPYQSTNYNLSYERYFGHGGLFSVAAFLFDVKSFPQTVNQIQPVADQDGVVRDGGVVTTYGNGNGGKIKGVEIGYQQQFDFLPGLLSGLGMQANYTFSDSDSSNTDLFGKSLPVPDNSKHQFNVVGLYQKGPMQARVAYNWRSDRYVGLQPVNGTQAFTGNSVAQNLAIFSEPVGYMDASASYDITKNVTVFVQGTNLTNAHDREYAQFKNQFYSESVYERRFTFGIRIRN
ncbi:TonB-dependent receptor [Novosphingobium terrae]|uniref:TonB-dependent receptor n=1 Tax=Novosphingobium terrae TaxID=2726189 RepID=UPI0019815FCF|nr:TonB-dependent receptor [Novosphingobium terrae]